MQIGKPAYNLDFKLGSGERDLPKAKVFFKENENLKDESLLSPMLPRVLGFLLSDCIYPMFRLEIY